MENNDANPIITATEVAERERDYWRRSVLGQKFAEALLDPLIAKTTELITQYNRRKEPPP